MKRFMVLYMAPPEAFEEAMKNTTPEEQEEGTKAWGQWMEKNKDSIVEGGAPLGKTKRVDPKGASDMKNSVGGYSIVEADSHNAAAKLFGKGHPHYQIPGAWVEIIEILPMPGA